MYGKIASKKAFEKAKHMEVRKEHCVVQVLTALEFVRFIHSQSIESLCQDVKSLATEKKR